MSKDTALVIIDIQVGIMEDSALSPQILAHINTLLSQARAKEVPIIYVQHDGPKGHDLEVGTPRWYIHPAIAPQAGETVIHKQSPDAFHNTSLKQELERLGIKQLVVAGGQTQYCVDTSVRRATAEGYNVTLVSDAHITSDTSLLTAPQIIAFYNDTLDGFWAGDCIVSIQPVNQVDF